MSETFPRISGFFDDSKAQIADLADQAAKGIVDFYDSLAVKSVNDAIIKVNDLLIALYVIEKTNPNANGKNVFRQVFSLTLQFFNGWINSSFCCI